MRCNSFVSSVCVTTATDVRLLATSDVSSWCVGVMRHCVQLGVVTSSPAVRVMSVCLLLPLQPAAQRSITPCSHMHSLVFDQRVMVQCSDSLSYRHPALKRSA